MRQSPASIKKSIKNANEYSAKANPLAKKNLQANKH